MQLIGSSLRKGVPDKAYFLPSDGTKHILLTPSMAAQCGYSMESDPWGNTRIYTSLMGCFVDNKVCFELKWFNSIQCNFLPGLAVLILSSDWINGSTNTWLLPFLCFPEFICNPLPLKDPKYISLFVWYIPKILALLHSKLYSSINLLGTFLTCLLHTQISI